VNALYEKGDRYGGPGVSAHGIQRRIAQADRLARAVGLDMVEVGWEPTVDNYLGRVTKPRILEAVREAKGEQATQLIDHLKKAEMAKEAERLLDGTGWLPEQLRLADSADREMSTVEIGELVMERLRNLDKIAYVRFASVHRDFQDVEAFLAELKDLLQRRT